MHTQSSSIRALFLSGPTGRLEALLNAGSENATHAALVCHPHPLYGGRLHKKNAFFTLKAGKSFAVSLFRFNFPAARRSPAEPVHCVAQEDAGHFCEGKMRELRETIEPWPREFLST